MNQTNRVDGTSQKYDATLDYGITMYDNLPYERNSDVCNGSTVALYSGHIIKYYLCNNQETCFSVNNRDDQIECILQKIREEEALRQTEETEPDISAEPVPEITEEQIQTLLEDSGENLSEEVSSAPEEIINLDDIEDW